MSLSPVCPISGNAQYHWIAPGTHQSFFSSHSMQWQQNNILGICPLRLLSSSQKRNLLIEWQVNWVSSIKELCIQCLFYFSYLQWQFLLGSFFTFCFSHPFSFWRLSPSTWQLWFSFLRVNMVLYAKVELPLRGFLKNGRNWRLVFNGSHQISMTECPISRDKSLFYYERGVDRRKEQSRYLWLLTF